MIIVNDPKLNGSNGQIHHGFFGRQGGVSDDIYKSLNCGIGSDDQKDAVIENKSRVAEHFSVKPDHLVTLNQIHSPDCLIITGPLPERPEADAMVTDRPDLLIGVLTADCGPILFAGDKPDGTPVVGAAHAGWGGALRGVLESTVGTMQEMGANPESIRAAVGPCIGPASYEVSSGFEKPFLERDPEDEHFFKEARKEGHLMFDLPGYIASRLAACEVRQVTITGHDTYALEDEFFSYRRKTHRNEADYGRQISVIGIKA